MKFFSLTKTAMVAASIVALSFLSLNADEKFTPLIVIHGGTSKLDLSQDEFMLRAEPMKKALKAGQAVLEKGGTAMDAVTAAIIILEDDPNLNAGKGAVLLQMDLTNLTLLSWTVQLKKRAEWLCQDISKTLF